jgi:hypothetical protein
MGREIIDRLQDFVGRRAALGRLAAGASALLVSVLGLPKEAFACSCCSLLKPDCVLWADCYLWQGSYTWWWVCCQHLDGTRWKCYECYINGVPPDPKCCNLDYVTCSKEQKLGGSCS